MGVRGLVRVLTVAVAIAACVLVPAAAQAASYKVPWNYLQWADAGTTFTGSPPGSNDFSCDPPASHPEPVVLVHGTFANQSANWRAISPFLANRSFCVFSLNYGMKPGFEFPGVYAPGGLTRMEPSVQQLSDFVDRVLEATGASRVDIVGHSQGSLMPNHYVRFGGGAAKVDDYVGLSTLWQGTNPLGLADLAALGTPYGFDEPFYSLIEPYCGSCRQFLKGSQFIRQMNEGGVAHPSVDYTNIVTRYDELVQPYTSGLMPPGPNVTNVVLQKHCPLDLAEHVAIAADPVAAGFIYKALDASAPRPPCTLVLPVLGAVGYRGN